MRKIPSYNTAAEKFLWSKWRVIHKCNHKFLKKQNRSQNSRLKNIGLRTMGGCISKKKGE